MKLRLSIARLIFFCFVYLFAVSQQAIAAASDQVQQVALPSVLQSAMQVDAGVNDHDSEVSSDKKKMFVINEKRECLLWDLVYCKQIQGFTGFPEGKIGVVSSAQFSPDGTFLVTKVKLSNKLKYICVWDMASCKLRSVLVDDAKSSFLISPDSSLIVVEYKNCHQVHVYNAATSELVCSICNVGTFRNLCMSPDSRLLLVNDDESSLMHVFDVAHGKLLFDIKNPVTDQNPSALFSPDSKLIATFYPDFKKCCLWQAVSGSLVATVDMPERWCGVRFSNDSEMLHFMDLSVSKKPKYSFAIKTKRLEKMNPFDGAPEARVVSHDGASEVFALGTDRGSEVIVRKKCLEDLYAMDRKKLLYRFRVKRSAFCDEVIEFSQDDRLLLTVFSGDMSLRDAASGLLLHVLRGYEFTSVGFVAQELGILTRSDFEHKIHVWHDVRVKENKKRIITFLSALQSRLGELSPAHLAMQDVFLRRLIANFVVTDNRFGPLDEGERSAFAVPEDDGELSNAGNLGFSQCNIM